MAAFQGGCDDLLVGFKFCNYIRYFEYLYCGCPFSEVSLVPFLCVKQGTILRVKVVYSESLLIDSGIFIKLSTLRRRHSGNGFIYTVEMGDVGKTGIFADFSNIFVGFHKHSLSIHDTGNLNVLNDSAVRGFLKFSAKVVRTNIKMPCKPFKGNLLIIVLVNVAYDIDDPVSFLGECRKIYFSHNLNQQKIQNRVHIACGVTARRILFLLQLQQHLMNRSFCS